MTWVTAPSGSSVSNVAAPQHVSPVVTPTGRLMVRVHPGEPHLGSQHPRCGHLTWVGAFQPFSDSSSHCQGGFVSAALPCTVGGGAYPNNFGHLQLVGVGDAATNFPQSVTPVPARPDHNRFHQLMLNRRSRYVYMVLSHFRGTCPKILLRNSVDMLGICMRIMATHGESSITGRVLVEVNEVLAQAKTRVEQGWCKGGLSDNDGNVCMRAAVGLAAGYYVTREDGHVTFPEPAPNQGHDWPCELAALKLDFAALGVLSQNLPTPFDSIPVFNDDPHTTLSDVLAVFDKAMAGGA